MRGRLLPILALALALTSCGGDDGAPTAEGRGTQPPPAPAAATPETTATEQRAQPLTPAESRWLAKSGVQETLAEYFGEQQALEGELLDLVQVGLTWDGTGLEVSSGDISFVVPADAGSCKGGVVARAPAPRLRTIAGLVRKACGQLERALAKLGTTFEGATATGQADYPAALNAMRRATRLAEQAEQALEELQAAQ